MKDFVGREISVGCEIVYPTRRGSSLNLKRGIVIEMLNNKLRVRRNSKIVVLRKIKRVVVTYTPYVNA